MQSTKIFIPTKCKVGFNTRTDTFTGKLGYIIYSDGKTWRKEPSWENWREKYITVEELKRKKKLEFDNKVADAKKSFTQMEERIKVGKESDYCMESYKKEVKDGLDAYLKARGLFDYNTFHYNSYGESSDTGIIPIEFDNTPLEGFVLNKKVGGGSSGWNHRSTYTRVYHPLGFEFEISIPNLLYILENADCIKGKGISGKCILGWEGKDLILIPEEAPEYKEMLEFTSNKSLKIAKKDLILGGIYKCNDGEDYTYMGESEEYDSKHNPIGKKLWIHDSRTTWREFDTRQTNFFKKFISINPDYANLQSKLSVLDRYKKVDIEYEIVDLTNIIKEYNAERDHWSRYSYSGKHLSFYTLIKKEYKVIDVTIYKDKNRIDTRIGRLSEEFDNLRKLNDKYTLYQIKTIDNANKK